MMDQFLVGGKDIMEEIALKFLINFLELLIFLLPKRLLQHLKMMDPLLLGDQIVMVVM